MDRNDNADHGNEPLTPCATKIWNVGIWITDLASLSSSLASSHADRFSAADAARRPLSCATAAGTRAAAALRRWSRHAARR